MRRLQDQIEVLRAIKEVREEFNAKAKDPYGSHKAYEVLSRLCTLYSLLDVERLESLAVDADDRDENFRKAA